MGADGHIAIYNYDKVKQIIDEINRQAENDTQKIRWWGYICSWQCNGKRACIEYWGDNLLDTQFDSAKEIWVEKDNPQRKDYEIREKLFERAYEQCQKEALLVCDQEVWT